MTNTTTISGPGVDVTVGEKRSIEDPSKPVTMQVLANLLSGGPTGAGKEVTPRTALRVSTVWACVRVIANAIARMPLIVYEKTAGGRERAEDHPLYWLLKLEPNPNMSAFTARKTLMMNALLWGNGYAEIVRRGDGTVESIIPIESWRVQPFIAAGELRYKVTNRDGQAVTLLRRDVLHIIGESLDGICGLSVVAHARQTIGTALAADEYAGGLIANGLRPGGTLSHPGKLGDSAVSRLRQSMTEQYAGSANAGKFLILEEGMQFNGTSMPLEDAQWVENSQFRVEEICRWFNVPPHKVGHLLRSTNNNIEAQGLDFLGDTLDPWVEQCEQEYQRKLFGIEDRGRYYAKHLTQSIVKLDTAARVSLYKGLRDVGAMAGDEVREREELNDLPEKRGTIYFVPSTMMPVPTPEQADQLLQAWIKKGASAGPSATGEPGGEPKPATDDQVAKAG